jgi:hypothetical protein
MGNAVTTVNSNSAMRSDLIARVDDFASDFEANNRGGLTARTFLAGGLLDDFLKKSGRYEPQVARRALVQRRTRRHLLSDNLAGERRAFVGGAECIEKGRSKAG